INLIDKAALNAMQKGAFLINCSRGETVVEDDLISALDSGHLSGATLDAFRQEPLPYGHPFWQHSKICVTPHIASLSAPDTAAVILADQLHCIRNRQSVANTVNFEQGY
ncbi:MAG: NAD(P)-dependent oxidoreductase, partial [Alphaproteobacteria bacterium]